GVLRFMVCCSCARWPNGLGPVRPVKPWSASAAVAIAHVSVRCVRSALIHEVAKRLDLLARFDLPRRVGAVEHVDDVAQLGHGVQRFVVGQHGFSCECGMGRAMRSPVRACYRALTTVTAGLRTLGGIASTSAWAPVSASLSLVSALLSSRYGLTR